MSAKRTSRRPKPGTVLPVTATKKVVKKKAAKKKAVKKKAATKSKTKRRGTKRASKRCDADDRDVLLDNFFAATVDAVAEATGRDDIVAADTAERVLICLPFPHLCWRYLFCSQGYPLGRLLHIFGPTGGCKSSLATEILRWHLLAGGLGVVIENENKDTPDLRRSLLQNPQFLSRIRIHPTDSMEEWQQAQTFWVNQFKQHADGTSKVAGPGRTLPYCMIVDSVSGTATKSELTKVDAEGFAGRGQYGAGAGITSNYCKTLAKQLRQEPFSLLWVNHQKVRQVDGMTKRTTPGGAAISFHASLELEVVRTKYLKLADRGGVTIQFTARKNCVGETGRRISANMLWQWFQDANGRSMQITFWDWYSATTELLIKLKASGAAQLKKDIQAVCGIQPASRRRAYSSKLGIPKTAPISYHEFGKRLESNMEMVRALEPVLGIAPRTLYVPGMDYAEQISNQVSLGEAAIQQMYASSVEMPAGAVELGDELGSQNTGYQFDVCGDDDAAYVGLDVANE